MSAMKSFKAKLADSTLYCLCLRPNDGVRGMIECSKCHSWFHFECIGLKESAVPKGEWCCKPCQALQKSLNQLKKDLQVTLRTCGKCACDIKEKEEKILQLSEKLNETAKQFDNLHIEMENRQTIYDSKIQALLSENSRKDEEITSLSTKLVQVTTRNDSKMGELVSESCKKDEKISSLEKEITQLSLQSGILNKAMEQREEMILKLTAEVTETSEQLNNIRIEMENVMTTNDFKIQELVTENSRKDGMITSLQQEISNLSLQSITSNEPMEEIKHVESDRAPNKDEEIRKLKEDIEELQAVVSSLRKRKRLSLTNKNKNDE